MKKHKPARSPDRIPALYLQFINGYSMKGIEEDLYLYKDSNTK
jgi:hypothetical protein